ncbi:MAG: hypothetical protein M3N33_11565 [Actinomycetota bacterium]|nr:hypothetical protein [Actinomycetota bacterium]
MDRGQEQERDQDQVRAGKERRMAMADDIRKLETVRERLVAVEEVAQTYPEGHHMRVRLENLKLNKVVEDLDEELRDLYDRSAHPRGT